MGYVRHWNNPIQVIDCYTMDEPDEFKQVFFSFSFFKRHVYHFHAEQFNSVNTLKLGD